MSSYTKNGTTFTGRTRTINGTTFYQYIDTAIMGRESLQWMSEVVYSMSEDDAVMAYAQMLQDEYTKEDAERIVEQIKDEDGEAITNQLIALRDNDCASIDNVRAALGLYADMSADDAPFNLGDIVLAVQDGGFGLARKLAAL